jgi:diaminopimelate epimerase
LTGVGADGVEFFAWTGHRSGRIRLHNSDGSIAEISGNGTRCVAAWMACEHELKPDDELKITTDAGVRICRLDEVRTRDGFSVTVTNGMGVPTFAARTVRLKSGMDVVGVEISTGNPHFVVLVDIAEFEDSDRTWEEIGAEICAHPRFLRQTNVEFVRIVNKQAIEIRIFERGVGPTTSSGTGSAAAAIAAIELKGCVSPVKVAAPGGIQTVSWGGHGKELQLTGPATLTARGEAW